MDFPGGADGKASAYNVGDLGSVPGSGRSSGEGNGNPLQYSCLENPMDGGAWEATVHGFDKSWTQLSDFTFTFHFHGDFGETLDNEFITSKILSLHHFYLSLNSTFNYDAISLKEK